MSDIPYPNPERLASILASPKLRTILPMNIIPPLTPTSIDSTPVGAFITDGYYPTTPKRTSMTFGSYSAQGDAATGQATIKFFDNEHHGPIAIPVAGYPLTKGIKIEIEQNDHKKTVIINYNPKESWGLAYAKVNNGPFSIKVIDLSRENTGWVAVGAPLVAGRWDEFTNSLLAHYYVFIIIGFSLVILLLTQCCLITPVTEPTMV